MTSEKIEKYLSKLSENSKPKWGMMTPQQMVEHLEYTYRIASGEIQDFEIATPEKYLEETHSTLYNYRKMPKEYEFPLAKQSKITETKHPDLETAKAKMLEARADYLKYFKQNPDAKTKNVVFRRIEQI